MCIRVLVLERKDSPGTFVNRSGLGFTSDITDISFWVQSDIKEVERLRNNIEAVGRADNLVIREIEIDVSWRYASYEV